MNKLIIGLLFVMILGWLFSCETREASPISPQEDQYLPLEKGRFVVYKVDEINYSLVNNNTYKTYYLKEQISDTIRDLYGNLIFEISRFKSSSLEEEWDLDSIWTARRNNIELIKVENNVPFVKLVLPLKEGKEWNGNNYNNKGKEVYRMENVHRPFSIDTIAFDSTLTQIQKRDSSSVSQDYRTEVYAKDIGLIYKKSIITFNRQEDGTIVIPIEIDNGIDYTQTAIGYGKE